MTDLQKEEDLQDLIQESAMCVLQFGDASCLPCSALRGRLEQWLERQSNVESRYIPIREYPALAAQMGIFSVPTILVFIQGKLIARESGYFSLDQIIDRVERTLKLL